MQRILQKKKRKRNATPAPVVRQRRIEFDDESVVQPKGRGVYFDDANFEIALKNQHKTASSCRSGRNRRVVPVFQSRPG